MLPDRLFARALLVRSLWFWTGARIALAVYGLLFFGLRPTPFVSPPMALVVSMAVASVVAFDAWQRRELLLLANMATRAHAPFVLGGSSAVLLELIVAAAAAVLGRSPT